jgi:hypothetical protein
MQAMPDISDGHQIKSNGRRLHLNQLKRHGLITRQSRLLSGEDPRNMRVRHYYQLFFISI